MERAPHAPRPTGGPADEEDEVRCLACGTAYAKPSGGGSVKENPGCPSCGYLGWVTAATPPAPASAWHPFVGDLPLPRAALLH